MKENPEGSLFLHKNEPAVPEIPGTDGSLCNMAQIVSVKNVHYYACTVAVTAGNRVGNKSG